MLYKVKVGDNVKKETKNICTASSEEAVDYSTVMW